VLALEHLHKYDIVYRCVPSLSCADRYLNLRN
jgi:hypothetical protein